MYDNKPHITINTIFLKISWQNMSRDNKLNMSKTAKVNLKRNFFLIIIWLEYERYVRKMSTNRHKQFNGHKMSTSKNNLYDHKGNYNKQYNVRLMCLFIPRKLLTLVSLYNFS